MNPQTGEIYTSEQMKEMTKMQADVGGLKAEDMVEMKVSPTQKQMDRKPPRVGRNEACPCGSGKKFKKCCLVSA